ncbi:MAG: hypothetical protein ACRC1H_14525, partial [Caldilineaceae bacterium]
MKKMRDRTNQTWAAKRTQWADAIEAAFAAKAAEADAEIARLRASIDEQRRTIEALMCGMPEDGTTPVIRRIAALEGRLEVMR